MHLRVLTVGDIVVLIVAVGTVAVETEMRRGPLQGPELAAEGHDRGDRPRLAPALQPRRHQHRRPDRPEEQENFHDITLRPLPSGDPKPDRHGRGGCRLTRAAAPGSTPSGYRPSSASSPSVRR